MPLSFQCSQQLHYWLQVTETRPSPAVSKSKPYFALDILWFITPRLGLATPVSQQGPGKTRGNTLGKMSPDCIIYLLAKLSLKWENKGKNRLNGYWVSVIKKTPTANKNYKDVILSQLHWADCHMFGPVAELDWQSIRRRMKLFQWFKEPGRLNNCQKHF